MPKTMQSVDVKASSAARHVRLFSRIGLVTALAALVGASCCALPLVLAWLGLAGAWIANLEVFVAYRAYTTAAAAILVGLGWVIAIRRRAANRTFAVLALATVLLVGAVLVPYYETALTRYLIALRRK